MNDLNTKHSCKLIEKKGYYIMIIGLGIDLVNIKRIERIINRWDQEFLQKVFTSAEIEYCHSKSNPYQYYAARFAAKEAAVKMLGKVEGISWQDIEVVKDENGKPELVFYGQAEVVADNLGIKSLHITISHEKEMAVAQVIGEGD